MKYLAVIFLLLSIGCETEGRRREWARDMAIKANESMVCAWSQKYEVCICYYDGPYVGAMTAVPDKVCKKCDETKCPIK